MTITVLRRSAVQGEFFSPYPFSIPLNTEQKLTRNPSSSQYVLYNMAVGRITPCFSSTSISKPPPVTRIFEASVGPYQSVGPYDSSPTTAKPTSAVVNIVIALPYPVQSPQGLSKPAKIGIGVGGAIAGIIIILLVVLLVWCRRRRSSDVLYGS